MQFQLKTEAVSPVWSHYDMYYEHYGVDEVHMTCRGPGLSGKGLYETNRIRQDPIREAQILLKQKTLEKIEKNSISPLMR